MVSGQCYPIQKINYCLNYSTTESFSQCIECEYNYYVDLNKNKCIRRRFSLEIENCTKMSIDKDQCSECIDNMIPTSDGRQCLTKVDFCQEYQISTVYSTKLNCL